MTTLSLCFCLFVNKVLKIALTKELKPIEWIEVENLPKSKSGDKPIAGSTH